MKPQKQQVPIDTISQTIVSGAKIPSAVNVEQAILGLLLIENSAATSEAMLILTPEAFFDPKNAMIFTAMMRTEAKGSKIDLYTVGTELKASAELATIGGMAHLTSLTQMVASGANVESHLRILLEAQAARAMVNVGFLALKNALNEEQDIADTITAAVDGVEAAMLIGLTKGNRRHIANVVNESIAKIKEREQRYLSGHVTGITTGIKELDRMTNGWQPSELVIVAARPAMGKTALALHFATSAAKSGIPVCIYSLEMSAASLGSRLLASQCNVEPERIRSGNVGQGWVELGEAETILSKLPIYVDDKGGVSMRYITTHSKIMARKKQCAMVIVDYLQLLDMRTVEKGRNREQEVAQASKAAKELAKELDIPVIMLAQLSRETEKRGNKTPVLSDLRESGAIEQDADFVLFIHRAEYYDRDHEFADVKLTNGKVVNMSIRGLGKLVIAKNREGSTGDVKFSYNPSMTHISDFDETPYIQSNIAYVSSEKRPVSSGSINYIAPTEAFDSSEDLPF